MTVLENLPPDPTIPSANTSLLRIATAGSVDDGKSTLIARLLLDTDSVADDHITALHDSSARRGHAHTNLALLTDGLRAEREEGITIDVAHRFFSTAHRSFILADSPGHQQYTRNMVTGTSDADVAIILVDARNGLVEQTRRHAYIVGMTGVPHIVLAVNKMDFVDWDESLFRDISADFSAFVHNTGFEPQITCIPVSALNGDNIATPSSAAPWYSGPPLLQFLEEVQIPQARMETGARVAVQWVSRPMDSGHHDYRGYAGRLWGGALRVGDTLTVLPHKATTKVKALDVSGTPADAAYPGQAITVQLTDQLDVGRGDLLAVTDLVEPQVGAALDADVCWMGEQPLRPGHRLLIKHTTRVARAIVDRIEHRVDVASGNFDVGDALELNDIGRIHIRISTALAADSYDLSRETGAFILVEESTNATVAAGLIRSLSR